MIKKILYLPGIVYSLVMYACSYDQLEVGQTTASASLGVTVSLDRMTGESALRASVIPEQGEEVVNSLYLYFFEESDARNGLYADCIKVEGELTMNSRYTLQTTGTAIDVFKAYNIIVIANIDDNQYVAGDMATWNEQWVGKSEDYFRTNALAVISGVDDEADNSKAIANDKILMCGETFKKAMDGEVSVKLVRNLARFDVVNNINNEYDLISTSIWNAYMQSSVTGDAILEYSKEQGSRTARFYGVDNSGNVKEGGTLGDIRGGLYAFENQVASPDIDDQYTTCLIVGLRHRADDRVGYYRVNIRPDESPQILKRNNVYKLNITGVVGDGAESETEAYASTTNDLTFIINNWGLGDNGLVVSNQNSILAIPVKTVEIGAAASKLSYTITTFSTLASPEPLAIKSQIYNPSTGKITASLVGTTLTISAVELPVGEEARTGVVTVSFAGLEAEINIVQSEAPDTYLDVRQDDNWTSWFIANPGLSSEYIFVKASGDWTAELYGEGFSFDPDTNVEAKTVLSSTSGDNTKFRVYTHSKNESEKERRAFIMISLDSNPINYVSVVPVFQKAAGTITISPNAKTVVFDGNGAITSYPDNTFEVNSATGAISKFVLSGANADRFAVDLPLNAQTSTLTVNAKDFNASGTAYTATLHIEDDEAGVYDITLVQNPLELTVTPAAFGPIAVTGGMTDVFVVSTDYAAARFTASVSMSSSTSGKTPYNHPASFVDENGEPINMSQPKDISTKFRVKMPEVYFPNREMDIVATVTVEIAGIDLSKSVTITQSALRSKGFKLFNARFTSDNNPVGNLHYGNLLFYKDALKKAAGNDSFWENGNDNPSVTQAIPTNTTFTHFASQGINESYDWSIVRNYHNSTEEMLMICSKYMAISGLNSSTSPLYGCNIENENKPGNYMVDANVRESRVGLFLTRYGYTAIADDEGFTDYLSYEFGYASAAVLPATAVAILKSPTGKEIWFVDPVNRLIYLGDNDIFGSSLPLGTSETLLYNFAHYIVNAAKYGHHFTDLLREDLDLPAPWDDVWAANKWTSN